MVAAGQTQHPTTLGAMLGEQSSCGEAATPSTISDLLQQQRTFFQSGRTQDLRFRLQQLQALKQAIREHEPEILQALRVDLHKSEFETYVTEIGISVLAEINYALRHLTTWAKPQSVSVPWQQFPATAQIYPEPLGVVLILSPWNYPFQLAMAPLVGAIAAGNCAILKPSELAAQTSLVLASMIQKTFDPAYIAVVEGGVTASQELLANRFDHIFFTGSTEVGKRVMTAAAAHLTPVTLEFGGEKPLHCRCHH
ncbi:aldehyde dehydrogenase family protein [Neosynechococcus sphagnicola]|uniref:aldehyde dehydrogenase family protein n=1 Tax=Neosynechococcus sphagnicola TaxID=1501145 RepID=UPI000A6C5924|nr:aldehyde dehydrogenase family protein [Neosynechococcus sphagnicola]